MSKTWIRVIGVVALWVGLWAPNAAAVQQIVVTPFQVFSGEDLTYLQKGIQEMLVSRLASAGKVTVVRASAPEGADANALIALAREKGADYILAGSITLLGGRVSTDAQVLDVATQQKALSFGRAGKEQADIIDHVDQLANAVNASLFGRAPAAATPSPSTAIPAQPATPEQPSIYQHPEKLLSGGALSPEDQKALAAEGAVGLAPLRLRSRRQKGVIIGVTSGDVTGDGLSEIITVTQSGLITVQRITEGRWVMVAKTKSVGNYISVDAADLNGNGKDEIFITNFDNRAGSVDSFVLEFKGNKLERVADRLSWYFRTVNVAERGLVLVSQRQGAADRFGARIYEMVYDKGSGYREGSALPLPRNLNVFGFAYGQVRENEGPETVAYNPNGYVQVLKRDGSEEWVTSDRYGGSGTFAMFPNADGSDREHVYIKPRIRLVDTDGDGINEILVLSNEQSSTTLERSRFFKKGRLVMLKWDELGMRAVTQTRSIAKYISDFTVVDLDGDSQPEMVAAVVQKSAGVVGKGSSFLAVFTMDRENKASAEQ